MAKKKAAKRRRPRATAAAKRRKPRRMNGAKTSPRSRARRRKMNGLAVSKASVMEVAKTGAEVVGGALAGMVGIGLLRKLAVRAPFLDNYYARAAIVGGVGVLGALYVRNKDVKMISIGVFAGAGLGAATKALQGTSIAAAMNGVKPLAPGQLKALAERMRKGGVMGRQPGTLTGRRDETLNGGVPGVLNGAYAGWDQLSGSPFS